MYFYQKESPQFGWQNFTEKKKAEKNYVVEGRKSVGGQKRSEFWHIWKAKCVKLVFKIDVKGIQI